MNNIQKLINDVGHLEKRNSNLLHLTANENQLSNTALSFLDSKLSERYYFGGGSQGVVDVNPFILLGLKEVENLIREAEKALKYMLKASVVNLNCLSGVHAMMCAILSTTEPGNIVMTVHHDHGGHFATKKILDRVGRNHIFIPYDLKSLRFDVDKIRQLRERYRIKAAYLDVSYYINPHNLKDIRKALGDDVTIIYDASHTLGLIMGGRFQDPFEEGADVICANTHKTLPGPQKGLIAFRNNVLGKKANAIINSCLYSSAHTHHLIALAITILEMKTFGSEYARQVVKNSNALGEEFCKLGYKVRRTTDGRISYNHQVHVFIDTLGDRQALFLRLLSNGISTNFDNPLGERLFIRIGTQETTRRGMKEDDMTKIAQLMDRALRGENVKEEVYSFNSKYKEIKFSFDPLIAL